ncbi:MAG: immunity 53 family protein [Planctomycetes bacterium]|nr:immunity 53 family protein [Planctomycetota bacterium]
MVASQALCFERLQAWFAAQCDGTWEHTSGIKIDTLDNPGWSVVIDLPRATVVAPDWAGLAVERSTGNWIRCWKEEQQFHGVGGVQNLSEIICVFLDSFGQ